METGTEDNLMKSPDTRTFLRKAALIGLAEVEAAKLALEASEQDEVRAFAARMQSEHEKANRELKRIAESESLDAPGELGGEYREHLSTLRDYPPGQFDAKYMAIQIEMHEEAVQLFAVYADRGDNERLTAYAAETLPALRSHLAQARDIRQKLGKAG